MLFPVTERAAIRHHTYTKQVITFRYIKPKINRYRLSGLHRELLTPGGNNLLRHRVEKGEYGCAFYLLPCQVGNTGSYPCLITHPYKARHIRSKHKLFDGDSRSVKHTRHHIPGMGIPPEIPTCQTLRHSEGESDLTLFIRTQLGIEESRFYKISTQISHRL